MKKIMTVIGARPQFIKAAPVSRAFSMVNAVDEIVVHTGQHFDNSMSDIFFDELGMAKPLYHLGVGGGGHGKMTGKMLQLMEPLMLDERPDCVLVYGDTNSTLAGALSASKLNIPVAHVEAGLRSFNKRMPEEKNRIVTDHLSDYLFAPTDVATNNLINEGIPSSAIFQVGDVMYDSVILYGEMARSRSNILSQLKLTAGGYVLSTIHRAENTDDAERLAYIMKGLERVAETMPVVLPLHPRTKNALNNFSISVNNIILIEPVGYVDMVALECQAAVIATDSGGVQKEAYFHGVPCVTLREETEWVELIDLGWNRLAKPNKDAIDDAIFGAINVLGNDQKPYGDGTAAHKIVDVICSKINAN